MHLLPKVFRTEGDMVDFDSSKIFDSIVKETGMSEEDARHITELVVRRIISADVKFLSGPHIREIVCSILSEQSFENERKLYTRIGMPLMDYEEILEKGLKDKSYKLINPEKIHHWAANQLAEEYSHLRILSSEESRAHLFGDIYIHELKYFDLRSLSQIWDPRIILKHGLPPQSNWTYCCKSGPAGILRVAVNHLAKWLGMTQGEFSGTQGLNFITTFLAPYAKGITQNEIFQAMQSLIYEINQLSAVIGRDIPITSISFCPGILELFENIPAIGPYGKIIGNYGDYHKESLKLFKSLIKIFKSGDYNGNAFEYPKHLIYLNEEWLNDKNDLYSSVWEEIKDNKNPMFMNLCPTWVYDKIKGEFSENNYMNNGTLQSISLNLPRYAFISKDEDEFIDIINDTIYFCSKILIKKLEIIKKRLKTKHLPICGGFIDDQPLFHPEKQNLVISFIGLNEAIKTLTEYELHKHIDAYNLGLKVVKTMNKICIELSEQDKKKYVLEESCLEKPKYRFAKLDLKHFPKNAIPQQNKFGHYYTNSSHFREGIDINLLERVDKQGNFQKIIQNGVLEKITLNELKKDSQEISKIIKSICFNSKISNFRFE